MKCELRKVWAIVTSKKSEKQTRPRSKSISCSREASHPEASILFHNKEFEIEKQTHIPYRIRQRRRRSQPEGRKGQIGRGDPWNSSPSIKRDMDASKKRLSTDFLQGLEIEDKQAIWNPLKLTKVFSDTSIQDGFLTTTLCSTELWASQASRPNVAGP